MYYKLISFFWLIILLNFSNVFSASWSDPWTDPLTIADTIKDSTQDTKLNDVSWWWSTPIYTTLQNVAINIEPYLDWWVYIWFSIAVILLIFNWLMMVFSPLSNKFQQSKKWIVSIIIGILVLTWFVLIIRIVVSFISNVVP